MLSQKTIETIKSTVPVLEVYGKEITTVFYKNLFEAHPELLNVFNQTNQKKGRQQGALANTVYAAAQNIDQLHLLLPAVKQIAHKHRSLNVLPEHYPIVGQFLLAAIKEVLKDAATDEIINAWAEAYGVIADVFISVEKEMYEEAESNLGWNGFKAFTITKKVKESETITSFYLQPADRAGLPAFNAGQYITVRIQLPEENYLFNRQYSLTAVSNGEYYRISVKREKTAGTPEGKVSNYLHDFANIGDTVEVTVPAGDFILDEDTSKPIQFIAAGVGITPFMSMLNEIANESPERNVSLLHAVQTKSVQPFEEELITLKKELPNFELAFIYETLEQELDTKATIHTGRITEEMLQVLDKDSVYYVCGPVPFMQFVINTLCKQGVPKEQIVYEFFGPSIVLQ